ncbi:uncharacterized protein LOC116344389 [Contarinia nasturtii]|uniref:uncharacterized protein LOC116344389 n=1 Tax=Contarinia nasturtii TaxID=265458 RepID=UPI0012D45E06|nr:uncharacterized protein LOC116344389 [Contarinia nasturtii]
MAISIIIATVLLQLFVCDIAMLPISNNKEILSKVTSDPSNFFHERSVTPKETEKTTIARDEGTYFSKQRTYSGSNIQNEPNQIIYFESNAGTIFFITEKPEEFNTLAIGQEATEVIDDKSTKRKSREIPEINRHPNLSAYKSMFNEKAMISIARAFGLLVVQVVVVPPPISE